MAFAPLEKQEWNKWVLTAIAPVCSFDIHQVRLCVIWTSEKSQIYYSLFISLQDHQAKISA